MPLKPNTADNIVMVIFAILAITTSLYEIGLMVNVFPAFIAFSIASILLFVLFLNHLQGARDKMCMTAPFDVAISLIIIACVASPDDSPLVVPYTMISTIGLIILIAQLGCSIYASVKKRSE